MVPGSQHGGWSTPHFWVEAALAAASASMLLLTLLWHDWIELVLRIDPDRGNGAVEWFVVVIAASAAVMSSTLAVTGWRRARTV